MTASEREFLKGTTCGPHCDDRVLHAPGSCSYCDEYPLLQKARQVWGICFTDDPRDVEGLDLMQCPAERRRSAADIHRWPGNRPS